MEKKMAGCNRPYAKETNELRHINAGYCRVSTYKQFDDGVSVEAQAERIGHYCAARDLPAPKIFTDAATGKSTDRAEWLRLKRLIDQGRVRSLTVYKIDRLSRSLRDLIDLVEALQRHQVELHVIAENVSTETSSGRLFFHILGALAQWVRETIGENTRQALRYKKTRGEYTGGQAPYGWEACETGRNNRAGRAVLGLRPVPAEQETLRLATEMLEAGATNRAIYRALCARGHRSRAGKPFHRKAVDRLIAGIMERAGARQVHETAA